MGDGRGCLASKAGRVVASYIMINLTMFRSSEKNDVILQSNWLLKTLFNIQGFDGHIFRFKGLLVTNKIGNKTEYGLKGKSIVEYGRKYFNCPKVQYIPLTTLEKSPDWHEFDMELFPTELMNKS